MKIEADWKNPPNDLSSAKFFSTYRTRKIYIDQIKTAHYSDFRKFKSAKNNINFANPIAASFNQIDRRVMKFSKMDFRISVVSQQIENRLNNNLEESAEYFNKSFEKFTDRTSDSLIDSQQSEDNRDEVNEKRNIIINMTVNVYKDINEAKYYTGKEITKDEKPASETTEPLYKFCKFVYYFGIVIGTIEHIDTVRHLLNWFWSMITN